MFVCNHKIYLQKRENKNQSKNSLLKPALKMTGYSDKAEITGKQQKEGGNPDKIVPTSQNPLQNLKRLQSSHCICVFLS